MKLNSDFFRLPQPLDFPDRTLTGGLGRAKAVGNKGRGNAYEEDIAWGYVDLTMASTVLSKQKNPYAFRLLYRV